MFMRVFDRFDTGFHRKSNHKMFAKIQYPVYVWIKGEWNYLVE